MKSMVSRMVTQIAGKKSDLGAALASPTPAKKLAPTSLREMLEKRRPVKTVAKPTEKLPVKVSLVKKAAVRPAPAEAVSPVTVVEVKPLSNRARVLRYLEQNGPSDFVAIQAAVDLQRRQLENVLNQLSTPTNRKLTRTRDTGGVSVWRLATGAAAAKAVIPPPQKNPKPKAVPVAPVVTAAKASVPAVPAHPEPDLQIRSGVSGNAVVTGRTLASGTVPVAIAEILLRAAREIQALSGADGLKANRRLVLSVEKV